MLKYIIALLITSFIALVSYYAINWGGTLNCILGLLMAGPLIGGSLLIKFSKPQSGKRGLQVFLISMTVAILWFVYAAQKLIDKAVPVKSVIIERYTNVETSGMGQDAIPIPVPYCKVGGLDKEIQCSFSDEIGDRVEYIYLPELESSWGGVPPYLIEHGETVESTIYQIFGPAYLTLVLYFGTFYIVWMGKLLSDGIHLLKKVIEKQTSSIHQVKYVALFSLSYVTFSFFVPVLFKNLYILCQNRFLYLTLTTVALFFLLATNYAERLFKFSTNLALDLESYTITTWFKHISKIVTYLLLFSLLLRALLAPDKSIYDISAEFVKAVFGLNFKSIIELYKELRTWLSLT